MTVRRALAAALLLAACPADEPTDAAPADPGAFGATCLLLLEDAWAPATWDAVIAHGDGACFEAARCGPGGRAVASFWEQIDEGSVTGFYAADGRILAMAAYEDLPPDCPEGATWYGEVGVSCAGAWRRSPGCARPDVPVEVETCTVQTLPEVVEPSALDGLGARDCVGLATCALGERTLLLVYRDHGDGGLVDAWDRATGEHVATLRTDGVSAGGADCRGLDVSACFPATFTPSAACGVPALP